MREVKVLDLHGMRLAPSPPPSLRLLTKLISLNLYGCVLKDIAMVAELTRLEILNLEGSEIQELPKEIGQLVYLRLLNLTNCLQLEIIPANVLSSLTNLEELYIGNCNIQWEVGGGKDRASLGELNHLNQLTTLDISIQHASVLPVDMNVFANLQRYNIFIGQMWNGDARETSRTLKLIDSYTNIWSNRGLQLLFPTLEYLSLHHLNFDKGEFDHPHILSPVSNQKVAMPNLEILELSFFIESLDKHPIHFYWQNLRILKVKYSHYSASLFSFSAARSLVKLQYLDIISCFKLREIFAQQEEVAFPNLETLLIKEMNSLRSIWNNQQAPNSFCKLKKIEINFCRALHHVFPIVVAKELRHLQFLKIMRSNNIETIVEKSDSGDAQDEIASTKLGEFASMNMEESIPRNGNKGDAPGGIVFTKLEALFLISLPRLTSFCKGSYNFKFPALQRVHVTECPNMKTFCHGNVITPSLSKVIYKKKFTNSRKDIWDGDLNTTLKSTKL
ncbi:hypothetical protein AAZV13_15G204600 [Glycine max]